MKRLALVATAAAAIFAAFAQSALAGGLVGQATAVPEASATGTDPVSSLTSTIAGATPPVAQATAVTRAAPPVAETASTAAALATQAAETAVAPVAQTAASATAPVAQAAASVLDIAEAATQPVLDAVSPAAAAAATATEPATRTITNAVPSASASASESTSAVQQPRSATPDVALPSPQPSAPAVARAKVDSSTPAQRGERAHGFHRDLQTFRGPPAMSERALGLSREPFPATIPGVPSSNPLAVVARGSIRPGITLLPPDRVPSGLLGGASASFGGGALHLLAALAALFVLAAPRPGRRLRPVLAPWRLPLLNLSLERPG